MTLRGARRVPEEVQEFLAGLASTGACFLRLKPGCKRPDRRWSEFERMHEEVGASRLDLALGWLEQGFSLGFMPRGDLWVLDVDDRLSLDRIEEFVVDRGAFGPRVSTPRGGQHFYFNLPSDLSRDGLKAHLLHPQDLDGLTVGMDFKFPGRTVVVAPGSVSPRGRYLPETNWDRPPIVDPRHIVRGLTLHHHRPEFIPCDRPLPHRIARAKSFLSKFRPAISGRGGRKSLAAVSSHLVAYLGLDPPLAYHLLVTPEGSSWNARCQREDGSPYPWSSHELFESLERAKNSVPFQGVRDFNTKAHREGVARKVERFLAAVLESRGPYGKAVTTETLHQLFLETGGVPVEACSRKRFGAALKDAGLRTRLATHARITVLDGIDLERLKGTLPLDPS